MTPRTWRTVVGFVAVVVLALVGTRVAGGDDATSSTSGPSSGPSSSPSSSRSASPVPSAPASSTDPETGLPWVDVEDLPAEVDDVLAAIDAGGPFDHPRDDGGVFSNREGLLPDQPRGYYREYTVETPGSRDRGARRIVTGAGPPLQFFWTDDHYDSFARVRR